MVKKNRLIITLLILIICLAFAEFSGILRSRKDCEIQIKNGAYFSEITSELKENNIIGSKLLFKVYSKIFASSKIGSVKSGTVAISGRRSYHAVINALTSDRLSSDSVRVTVPEGYNLKEIKSLLIEKGLVSDEKFDESVSAYKAGYSWEDKLPSGENRLEGFLFPDTYYFSKQDDETQIVNSMTKRFDEIISGYSEKIKSSGYDTYEIITLASMIEKEAVTDEDFRLVSSVFHNRLKRTDNLKYLQSCATVQYIINEKKKILSNKDIAIDSPYNTYKYPGLPVGPIASPGERAIKAALEPADTNYIYFLNDKNGNLHFASDYATHLKNIKEYQ